MPTRVVVKPADVADPPLSATLAKPERAATRLVPAHVESPGPKSAKVTVPVGLKPPVTLPLSLMTTPTVPCVGEGVVAMAGEAGPTVTCSAPQALTADWLF